MYFESNKKLKLNMRSQSLLTFFLFLISYSLSGQIFVMDGSPVTSCSGFFLDSGGGNGDYSANENYTTTICSDGISGTHVKLNFSGVFIEGGDMLCFFDGPDATAPQLSCHTDFLPNTPFIIQATAANPSGCVTVTFNSDGTGQDAGFSADIDCIPSCQTILATLISTDPVVMPVDTGYIDICPGDRVFFNATGEYPQDGLIYNHSDFTSSFTWDFGDGNSAVGPNTSHIYEEPGGYVVELYIEDQLGCTNTNFISQRIRVSTYPDFEIAGDIPDQICAGDTISLDANVTNIDSTFEVSVTPTPGGFPTGGVRSDSLPLPDGTGATYSTSIVFNNFSPGQVLTDINDLLSICVNMEHSWMHDLQIDLVCPDGTTVVLQQQVFQGLCLLGIPDETDEGLDPPLQGVGWDYCWTPGATNGNWTEYWQNTGVGTLPEGDYNAFGNLEDFLGCPLNGEWTIVVQDLWGIDNGWIFEWSIDFAPELYPNVETFTPELINWQWEDNSTIVYYSNDSITAALNNAGSPSYTFTVEDNFGCTYDTTVVVNVLPPTHPECFQCQDIVTTELQDSTICEGEVVEFNAESIDPLEDQAITFEAFSNTEFDGDIHPPGNPIVSSVFVDYINPLTLTDPASQIESVCVNIEHSYDADIEIRLQAPNGTIIELSTDNGGSGDDYINACFTPGAATPITSGSPPFTGDWQPEGNWGDLIGTDITGNWTLLVADDQNGFDGVFIDWSITFNTLNELNYLWTNTATLSCNNCPDPIANPTSTTEYIVNAVDLYGCNVSDTVTVEVVQAFAAPILTCGLALDGNLTIDWSNVPGAGNYEISLDGGISWIPANGPLSHTISGLVDGNAVNILVRVVSLNANCPPLVGNLQCLYVQGCTMSIDTSATIPPSCWNTADASVFMSATGAQSPVTYSIDGGADQGPNFTGVSAGLHTIIATDNSGCMDTVEFTIIAPNPISLDITMDSISCNGDCDGQLTALATGGTGAFGYVWNTIPATFSDVASGLCFGNYSVTATDDNGCSATGDDTVEQPVNLLITSIVTDNISCFGAMDGAVTVTPFGGTPPYSYQWDDPSGQTGMIATGLGPGIVNVTITDANNCITIGNAGVFEPAASLTGTISQTIVGCGGAMESTAQVTPMGGTPPYSFSWSNGDMTDIAQNLDAITYFVTITDDNDCEVVVDIDITQLDPVIVMIDGIDPTCFGLSNGEVSVTSVNGGASNYTYAWNTTPVQTGTSITNVPGGNIYTLVVTDQQGCTGSASYSMGQPNEIQLSLDATEPTCNSFSDGEATVLNVSGGMPNYTFQWDANAGGQNTQTATNLGVGLYSVTVTDMNMCTTSGQVQVEEPATMQLSFQEVDNTCPGFAEGSISLTVSGGTPNYTYQWSNGATTQNIDTLLSGVYIVTVTDGNGCFVIDTSGVDGQPPIQADVQVEDVSCFGEADGSIIVNLNGGSPPYQYSLDNIEFTGSNILIGLEAGVFDLYAVDVNGCPWSTQVTIDSPDEFSVTAGPDQEILLGDSVQLVPNQSNGVGFVNYQWFQPYVGTLNCENDTILNCDLPWASPENTITYEVYGVDQNGCEDTDFVMVRVIKEREVYVATGFTPNNDGRNDLLMVHGPVNTEVTLFRVFDRWGNMVFEYDASALTIDELGVLVNDQSFGWDGTFRGEEMNPGVFVWYCEVEYIDGFRDIFKGNTTLIR